MKLKLRSLAGPSAKSVMELQKPDFFMPWRRRKKVAISSGHAKPGLIGPSPFHGNFAVQLNDQDEPVLLERTPTRAYDEFIYKCSASSFATGVDAIEFLFDEIKDELSFFYYLKGRHNNRLRVIGEVRTLTSDLLDIYENKGVRAWVRRLFSSSSKMRYLSLKTIIAEYNAQVQGASDARDKDELYSSDVKPYFREEVEDVMAEDLSGFTSGARDVANLLSEVRARQIEVTSLFMSAVAGGVAGALISLLVH